ncbi:hypothetical protein D3C81_1181830 [compost metagenome]
MEQLAAEQHLLGLPAYFWPQRGDEAPICFLPISRFVLEQLAIYAFDIYKRELLHTFP